MITQVEVLTPKVTLSPLPFNPLGSEANDPIQIHNIDGLGPVTAAINTTQYGLIEGASFDGSSVGPRNIVITVGLNPNWADQDISTLRALIYQYFMPQKQVTLKFTCTHMADVQIDGYVESMDPNIFSQNPELVISIICPLPAFVASAASVIPGITLALPDGDPTEIDYEGTLDAGFVLDVVDTADSSDETNGEVRVINENPDLGIFIVTATINSGQFLRISTLQGNKYVRSITNPGNVATSILGKQAVGSVWLQLVEGANLFRVMSTTPSQAWTLTYYARYGGL